MDYYESHLEHRVLDHVILDVQDATHKLSIIIYNYYKLHINVQIH